MRATQSNKKDKPDGHFEGRDKYDKANEQPKKTKQNPSPRKIGSFK